MDSITRYNIKVNGRVQGVFFRKSTQDKARELGLTGFVRNEPDGSVYIEAQGDPDQVKNLLTWCYNGPPSAIVNTVNFDEKPPKAYDGFQVHH